MNFLRKEIKTRRILVKPSFQDFDRINVLHVTYEQFTRALTKLGLNMPDLCFKILARKYMDKNNAREINYDRFLKDADYEHGKNTQCGPCGPGMTTSQQIQGAFTGRDSGSHQGHPQQFSMEHVDGTNANPEGLVGQTNFQGAGDSAGNTYNVNLMENNRKSQFDEANLTFPRAEHPDFRAAGLDNDVARNKSKLTALGNSQLRVKYFLLDRKRHRQSGRKT